MSDQNLPSLAGLRGPVPRIDTESENSEKSEKSDLAPIQRLPDDVLKMIRSNILDGDDTDDVCKNFARYCASSKIMCNDEAWKQACEVLGVFDNLKVEEPHFVGTVLTDVNAGVRDERNVVFSGMSYKKIFLTLCDELAAQRVVLGDDGTSQVLTRRFDDDWRELYLETVQKESPWGFEGYFQLPHKRMHSMLLIRDTMAGSYLQRLFHAWGFTGTNKTHWEGLDRILIKLFMGKPLGLLAAERRRVKKVIQQGADVDFAHQEGGWTPLGVAALEQNLNGVNLLLENNADPNKPNNDGETPLMSAMSRGSTDTNRLLMVKALLEYEADVNLEDNDGRTAPDIAIIRRHTDCAVLMVQSPGFNANKMNDEELPSSLRIAIQMRNVPVINAILPLINDENINRNGKYWNILVDAVLWHGDVNVVRALLSDPRVLVNHRSKDNKTALGYARQKIAQGFPQYQEIVDLLLEHNAVE